MTLVAKNFGFLRITTNRQLLNLKIGVPGRNTECRMFFVLAPPSLASSTKSCWLLLYHSSNSVMPATATEIFIHATADRFWALHSTQVAQ